MYMWWWKSADILHEHKLSTPHGPYWRFTDYVIWLIKIYFYKGYKTIYYKLWEKSAFHASSPCGPNRCNSSCPVKLSNFFTLITWASRSTLDSLSVHFKEQKETCIVHGSLRFLMILFTGLAVSILTNKGLLRTIWKIMTHHAINKSKMPWN